jgi:hypothetical protein
MSSYPHEPGVRHNSTGGTAEAARETIRAVAPSYEAACLAYVEQHPCTPDEAHARLERELGRRVPLYSVRPRFSTLKARGLVADSGLRRAPPGGCKAVVWRATTAEERAIFNAQRAFRNEKEGGE